MPLTRMSHATSDAAASNAPPARTGRWLMLTCAGLIALALGAAVLAIWDARREALARYQQTETNLGFVLAEQTARSIQGVDLVVQAIRAQVLASGVTTPAEFAAALNQPATGQALSDRLRNLPQAAAIHIVSADGRVVASSVRLPETHGRCLGPRVLRLVPRASGGHPVHQPAGARPPDPGLDRLCRAPGRRAGRQDARLRRGRPRAVVFRAILPRHRARRRHGDHPDAARRHDPRALSGVRQVCRHAHAVAVALVRRGGARRRPVPLRWRTDRRVPAGSRCTRCGDYNLAVDVSFSEAAALRDWRRQSIAIGCGTLAVVATLVLLFRALAIQFRRLAQSEASLAQRNEEQEAARAAAGEPGRGAAAERGRRGGKIGGAATTLEFMDQGIMMVNADRIVVVCNAHAMQMLDLPAEMMTSPAAFCRRGQPPVAGRANFL